MELAFVTTNEFKLEKKKKVFLCIPYYRFTALFAGRNQNVIPKGNVLFPSL